MIMNEKIAAVLLGVLLLPLAVHAQFRKYSNEFLNIGAGARGLAFNVMHAEYFAGIGKFDYLSAAIPVQDNRRTLGISLLRFAVDDIPNTLFLVEPDGSVNFNNIQTFSSADYALLLSFAQTIKETEDESLSFGANAKIIRRTVGKFAGAWGFGLDAGIQYRRNRLRLGVAARDVTTTFNAWSFNFTEREKEVLYLTQNEIPVKSTELTAPRLILGGAYQFDIGRSVQLMAEANLNLTFDGKRNTLLSSKAVSVDPSIGLEAAISNVFYVRAGVANFQRALADGDTLNQKRVWIYQPSLGAGFKMGNVTIDYAYSNLANQNNPLYTHVFSLRFNLAKKQE